ncbi:MAG: hypothetical protein P4M13_03615 [Alphaproteobacteria bacterium]|nr:hypothetical protein [Alphaproteobacteria bacterium]
MLGIIVVGYAVVAALSLWFVAKVGAGKKWARSSFLWSFVLQIAWMLCPPYHGVLDYMTDLPDIALQFSALYLLYTEPGRLWFRQTSS